MKGKKQTWAMSALLGALIFIFTTGTAMAYPVFYVKLDNRTNQAIRIQWHFHTRNGATDDQDRFSTIYPNHTLRVHGPRGMGALTFRYNWGGGQLKSYTLTGDANPDAPAAYFYFKWDNYGHLRCYKPAG